MQAGVGPTSVETSLGENQVVKGAQIALATSRTQDLEKKNADSYLSLLYIKLHQNIKSIHQVYNQMHIHIMFKIEVKLCEGQRFCFDCRHCQFPFWNNSRDKQRSGQIANTIRSV